MTVPAQSVTSRVLHVRDVSMVTCFTQLIVIKQQFAYLGISLTPIMSVLLVNFRVRLAYPPQQIAQVA